MLFNCRGARNANGGYNSNTRAPYYKTVKEEKIKFYNENDLDPDWIIKQCYMLLLGVVLGEFIDSETC